jgi:hypothetical protein
MIPFFVYHFDSLCISGAAIALVDSLEPKPIARRPLGTPRRLSWSTLGRNWNATNHN